MKEKPTPNIRVSHAPNRSFEIGMVITTYNRPYYLWKTLRCLQKTVHSREVVLVVVDDASSSRTTLRLIKKFAACGLPVATILKQERKGFGVHDSLRAGWDYLLKNHSPKYLCNIDSDVLMKPGWFERVRDLYVRERAVRGPLLVTGFHTNSHPIMEEHDDFLIKFSAGGLNLFFDAAFYREIVKPCLVYSDQNPEGWDWEVIHAMREKNYPVLCTKPSMLQHIGKRGKFSRPSLYDYSQDF